MNRSLHVAVCAALLASASSAQFLYNDKLAKKSEEALNAAKAVTSGALFDKQLANLDLLAKASSGRVFEGAEREMRMRLLLLGGRDWNSIAKLRESLAAEADRRPIPSPSEIEDAKVKLKSAKDDLATELSALKAKIKAESKGLVPNSLPRGWSDLDS